MTDQLFDIDETFSSLEDPKKIKKAIDFVVYFSTKLEEKFEKEAESVAATLDQFRKEAAKIANEIEKEIKEAAEKIKQSTIEKMKKVQELFDKCQSGLISNIKKIWNCIVSCAEHIGKAMTKTYSQMKTLAREIVDASIGKKPEEVQRQRS